MASESLITGSSSARVSIKQSSRSRIASNRRMSEPNIVSNFGRPAVRKNILSCRPASPVFFRVTMAGNKFVFRQENLLLYLGFSILLKAECESQCNVRCVGKDSSEGWRDRLDGGVREANVEIQPGSYFGRFDTLGDSDHLNSDELVSWTGMRHTANRNACRPGAITKELLFGGK